MKKRNNEGIVIEPLKPVLSLCKVKDYSFIDINQPFVFIGTTDNERSLICPVRLVPQNTIGRDDGWRAFRIFGELEFSLIGIMAGISDVLAENEIGIMTISTYNTDYVLVREHNYERALIALEKAGYEVMDET